MICQLVSAIGSGPAGRGHRLGRLGLRALPVALLAVSLLPGCRTKDQPEGPAQAVDTAAVTPLGSPVTVAMPNYFGSPARPGDQKVYPRVVDLGRHLFFEKALSQDRSISCASCHDPNMGFSDGRSRSLGVNGSIGSRNAMSLINLAWNSHYFWDGRAGTLQQQALMPIAHPDEMNLSIAEAVARIKGLPKYDTLMTRAYGDNKVTASRLADALAQFERTLVSSNSRYDKYLRNEGSLTPQEIRGMTLFFTHPDAGSRLRGGNCGDCHLNGTTGGKLVGFEGFANNGTQADLNSPAADKGLELFTRNPADRGKFRIPNLRNIELTAPYMHDGRFGTLEEVLDHYNHADLFSRPNVDTLIKVGTNRLPFEQQSLGLTAQEKADIIAFLKTLTDQEFATNPNFREPAR